MEIRILETNIHQCTEGQLEVIGGTMVDMKRGSGSLKALLGILSKNERGQKTLVHISSVLSDKIASCTRPLSTSGRAQGSLVGLETDLSRDISPWAEGVTVAFETTESSLEDQVFQLGRDMRILKVGEKQEGWLQASLPISDNETAIIQSIDDKASSLSIEGEILKEFDRKNGIVEPNNREANQSIQVPFAWKDIHVACPQMEQEHLSDISSSCCPLQNLRFAMLKGDAFLLMPSMSLNNQKICRDTCQRLDNLEETIRELEMTINKICCEASAHVTFPQNLQGSKAIEKGERKVDMKRCRGSSKQHEESHCLLKSSPTSLKPPLLPKPQLLFNYSLQVDLLKIYILILLYL